MADELAAVCDPTVTPIGKGGGWYHVGNCPAHPSFSKTVQGYRAARSLASSHEARRLPPEPPRPTVQEGIQHYIDKAR